MSFSPNPQLLSLLSLSDAAASIARSSSTSHHEHHHSLSSLSDIAASLPHQATSPPAPASQLSRPATRSGGIPPIPQKTRRLSSAGQTRRRMSDATAATATVNAVMSRVSSSGHPPATASHALSAASAIHAAPHLKALSKSVPRDGAMHQSMMSQHSGPKKKGQTYQCESCSKVYRHPSCLVKHRWEHSPHWREASKFLLSKHQQVQLLEAAAILSHITPGSPDSTSLNGCGTSLPEDRSMWPFYVSGGALPAPSSAHSSCNDEGDDVDVDGSDEGYYGGGKDKDSGYASSNPPPVRASMRIPALSHRATSNISAANNRHIRNGSDDRRSGNTQWRGSSVVSATSTSASADASRSYGTGGSSLERSWAHIRSHHGHGEDDDEGIEVDGEGDDGDGDEETVDGSDEWDPEGGMVMDMDL